MRLRVNAGSAFDESSRNGWPSSARYSSTSARVTVSSGRTSRTPGASSRLGGDAPQPLDAGAADEPVQHRLGLVVGGVPGRHPAGPDLAAGQPVVAQPAGRRLQVVAGRDRADVRLPEPERQPEVGGQLPDELLVGVRLRPAEVVVEVRHRRAARPRRRAGRAAARRCPPRRRRPPPPARSAPGTPGSPRPPATRLPPSGYNSSDHPVIPDRAKNPPGSGLIPHQREAIRAPHRPEYRTGPPKTRGSSWWTTRPTGGAARRPDCRSRGRTTRGWRGGSGGCWS